MNGIGEVLEDNLTEQQLGAAIDEAAEVLTLACAGSGKSRTLAYRIARLLAQGESPNSIVAFTFTDKAAESIKRRTSSALASAGIDPTVMGAMFIGTIHSYCQRILGEIDATFRQFDVLDENRLALYLISRYRDLSIAPFRGRARGARPGVQGQYFDTIRQLSFAWRTSNDEMIDYNDVRALDPELGNFLIQLQSRLTTDQYLDFSLMIRNVVEALRRDEPRALQAIAEVKHLMCDEYQDVNPSQEALIELIRDNGETLFVVGDDDQSIYGWRGADVSNILTFQDRYPDASVHTLSENFRSTTPIVEGSSEFVAAQLGPSRIPKTPTSVYNRTPQQTSTLWFTSREEEAEWVAQRIESLLGTEFAENDGTVRGLTPADFAILMRSTRTQEQTGETRHSAFTRALRSANLPYSLEAGGGPFEREQVAVLRSTFELLRNETPDRNTVRRHFDNEVLPAYPNANFDQTVRVLTDWGRLIHRPQGSARVRLYPQKLVYDLLSAFGLANSDFSDSVLREIGLFSQMILDVETVYLSVDSRSRFSEMLNFLAHIAEAGYDVSTDDLVQRPDAVTVSTVHKMKGLEFPCVFVVDAEHLRFPKKRTTYDGWIPRDLLQAQLARGLYGSSPDEEARLFYTAITRAERFLYVSGAELLPGGRQNRKQSRFALTLAERDDFSDNSEILPENLEAAPQVRRVEDTDYPTSFSELRYYLKCPKSYQFRERFGFNPVIPEMFGFGRTVHTSIQKLHERYPDAPPSVADSEAAVRETFHLKHIPQSADPENRPGGFERALESAVEVVTEYSQSHTEDFTQERTLEAVFEIPAENCVISGAIDLLLREDDRGRIVDASIVDFKAMEGGEVPTENEELDWTELSLQVQLYARAAAQVLSEEARTGNVHLLKDNQRIEVPVDAEAVAAALANVEWAVRGILQNEFPMRPETAKCEGCDFSSICPRTNEEFSNEMGEPPAIFGPDGEIMIAAFREIEQ